MTPMGKADLISCNYSIFGNIFYQYESTFHFWLSDKSMTFVSFLIRIILAKFNLDESIIINLISLEGQFLDYTHKREVKLGQLILYEFDKSEIEKYVYDSEAYGILKKRTQGNILLQLQNWQNERINFNELNSCQSRIINLRPLLNPVHISYHQDISENINLMYKKGILDILQNKKRNYYFPELKLKEPWSYPEVLPPGLVELFLYSRHIFPTIDINELWNYVSSGLAFKGAEFIFRYERCFLQAGRQNSLELYNYFGKIFDTTEGIIWTIKGAIENKHWILVKLLYDKYIKIMGVDIPSNEIAFALGLGNLPYPGPSSIFGVPDYLKLGIQFYPFYLDGKLMNYYYYSNILTEREKVFAKINPNNYIEADFSSDIKLISYINDMRIIYFNLSYENSNLNFISSAYLPNIILNRNTVGSSENINFNVFYYLISSTSSYPNNLYQNLIYILQHNSSIPKLPEVLFILHHYKFNMEEIFHIKI